MQASACKFIKKETLAQVFSCEFREMSKDNFFAEHLWTTAYNKSQNKSKHRWTKVEMSTTRMNTSEHKWTTANTTQPVIICSQ